MSVLLYTENWDGKFKKVSFELASYAAKLAAEMGVSISAISLGPVEEEELTKLGNYGIPVVLSASCSNYTSLDNQAIAHAVASAAQQIGATVVILAQSNLGKAIAPRLSVKLKAGMVSGVQGLPVSLNPFTVKKMVFTGKAFANISIQTAIKVITLAPNSFGVFENPVKLTIGKFDAGLSDTDFTTRIESTNKVTGKVLLTDADIVVSAGRGLKAPENWGPIEELAALLGAGIACSRPVSDEGWRSHNEHVGQTGKIISPNLYFAFGISGAIQHLGGVSASKCIVAINKDKDAPIFEAADYGIVGDVFKVLPQLIEAVKESKS
ncbi:MAG: electron transfer flavoprotein subunit alpha/FixB family protein [Bacteroidales bacterium]|nr:electron transfer flavoprotein subunit alpha/FixB family protein [Bacteroidales bacterium]